MATTLSQITQEFYDIVGTNSNSTVYTETFVNNLANDIQQEICRNWKFPFIKTKTLFNTAPSTTLSSALTTTDTEITVGSITYFPTSGALWIEHDVVNYTGVSDPDFTGVTNIDIDHASGVEVEALYSLPANFSHDAELWLGGTGNTGLVLFDYVQPEDYDTTPITNRWTIVTDKDSVEYIRVNTRGNSVVAVFNYHKIPATMTASVNATIPDQFAKEVISRTMAGTAKIIKGDDLENLGSTIQAMAKQEVIAMRRYYTRRQGADSIGMKSKYKSRPPRTRKIIYTS